MAGAPPDRSDGRRGRRFLVIGSVNMDLLLQTEKAPVLDGAVLVTNSSRMPGGHAANCASALKAMGAEVGLIGAVGDDGHGRNLIADLVARGIDVEGVQMLSGHPTGEVVIPTRGTEHFMFVLRGANDHASTDLATSMRRFRPEALVVFDPSRDVFRQIYALYRGERRDNVPIYWIPGGINCEDPSLAFMLDLSDVAIVNAAERNALLAHAPVGIMEGGRCGLVTTMGSLGARLQCGALDVTMPVSEAQVQDSVGAGDAFAAAYILARQANLPPTARLTLANAAGTVAVGSAGARAAVRGLADLGDFHG